MVDLLIVGSDGKAMSTEQLLRILSGTNYFFILQIMARILFNLDCKAPEFVQNYRGASTPTKAVQILEMKYWSGRALLTSSDCHPYFSLSYFQHDD